MRRRERRLFGVGARGSPVFGSYVLPVPLHHLTRCCCVRRSIVRHGPIRTAAGSLCNAAVLPLTYSTPCVRHVHPNGSESASSSLLSLLSLFSSTTSRHQHFRSCRQPGGREVVSSKYLRTSRAKSTFPPPRRVRRRGWSTTLRATFLRESRRKASTDL